MLQISKSFRQPSSYLLLSRSVALNDGQDQMRGVRTVMIDAVNRLHKILLCFRLNRSAGVRIAIKAWEVPCWPCPAAVVVAVPPGP